MTRFATVLFDLDGTLVDSIADLTAAGNHVCRAHGWPEYDAGEFKRLVGHGQANLVRSLARDGLGHEPTEELARRLHDEFTAYYQAHKADHTAPYPGILQALDALAAAGVHLGVLTNKDDAPAQALVASLFGGRFDAVQGRAEGMPPKPDPTGAHMLMGRLGADPSRTLMVGDSEPDMQVAQAAGVASCGVLWGYRTPAELVAAGARHLAASPEQLASYVLEPRDI